MATGCNAPTVNRPPTGRPKRRRTPTARPDLSVEHDAAYAADVVAAELLRPFGKRWRADEGEQLLQRRLEIVAPPHHQIEALLMQRHEAEAVLGRDRTHGQADVGLSLNDREPEVVLRA